MNQSSLAVTSGIQNSKIPLVALIGFPNSGKSTLLNRLGTGRKAVVANEAHTTRDLNYAEDTWESMYMRFVDTGGLVPDPADKIQKMVQIKTWGAIQAADLLVLVLDRKTNPETVTIRMLQQLWKSGKPFIIGVNKVDNPNTEKSIVDYASFGGVDFVNFSAVNGYNLNDLMDKIVEQLEKLGFRKNNFLNYVVDVETEKREKKNRNKIVRKNQDGTYMVVRENSSEGPGLFRSLSKNEVEDFEEESINEIENVVSGVAGLLTESTDFTAINPDYSHFLRRINDRDLRVYYLESLSSDEQAAFKQSQLPDFFDSGLILESKADRILSVENFVELMELDSLDPSKTLYIDDVEENILIARALGMWTIQFSCVDDKLNKEMFFEYEKIRTGKVERVPKIPKILFLGKPNVGKSSLFNAMVGKEIQIVTEIAGTTLSVNDTMVERTIKNKPVCSEKKLD